MGRIIFAMALIRILDEMDDETAKEFEEFLSKNQNPEDILKFLEEKIPNLEEILVDEARTFKSEVFDVLKEAKKIMNFKFGEVLPEKDKKSLENLKENLPPKETNPKEKNPKEKIGKEKPQKTRRSSQKTFRALSSRKNSEKKSWKKVKRRK